LKGLDTLLTFTFGTSVDFSSLKQAWSLIEKKFASNGSQVVVEWTKLWKSSADELSCPSAGTTHTYLAQLRVVVNSASALSLATSDDPVKLKALLTTVANLLQPLGLRRQIASVYAIIHRFMALPCVAETSLELIQASNLEKMSSFVNVVTFHAIHAKNVSDLLSSLKFKLIDMYCEHVVSSKTAPTANTVHAFHTLLQEGLSSENLAEKVFPAMERMIPRTPDCLPHIAQGLALISSSANKTLDFVNGSAKMLASITEYIIASSEAPREHAQSIIRSLCTRINDGKALTPLVEKLTVLLNKQLNNWFERAGLFASVGCVAQSSPVAISVESLFPLLVRNMEKEKNKDAIVPAVQATISWICVNPTHFLSQDSVLQALAKGLADSSKDIVYLYLTQIYLAINKLNDATVNLSTLIKPLVNFVLQSKTKSVLIPEALISLAILQRMATIGVPYALKSFETDQLWATALDSCFRSQDVLLSINEVNKALNSSTAHHALIGLISSALVTFPTLKETKTFTDVLPQLLTHSSAQWRRSTISALATIHQQQSEELSKSFSELILTLLEETLTINSLLLHEDARSSPHVLVEFFKLALTPLLNVAAGQTPRLVLIASHPLLKGRYASGNSLSLVTSALKLSEDDLVNQYGDEIIAYLMSDSGLNSSDAMRVQAARSAIARLLVSPISSKLVDILFPMLSFETCKTWLSFTTAQVATFHTPEGQVYSNIQMDEIPEVKDSKNARKEDDRDAKRKAAEVKKKATDLAMAKFTKQQSEALAAEKLVRAKVAPVYHSLAHGLNIAHEAARAFPAVFAYRDAFFISMIMDTVAALSRYETEFQTLSSHVLQWLVQNCFARSKYLSSRDSHLSSAIAKPSDSDLQAQVIEDINHNVKSAIDATSWAIFQPVAVSAITPLQWIVGHGFNPNKDDKNRGNTESAQHLPRHVQELAFTALDHNKKHVNPSLTQCLLTALDSSPTFSSDARTAIVESAPYFHFQVPAHKASLEVLIAHLDHANAQVRLAVLDTLVSIPKLSQFGHHDDVSTRLWKTRFDTEPDNSDLAVSLYKAYSAEHPLTASYWDFFVPLLSSESAVVRDMAAKAIVGGMNLHPSTRVASLEKVLDLHRQHYVRPDETDASNPRSALSRSTVEHISEGKEWFKFRLGAASVLAQFGQLAELPESQCSQIFEFLIENALFESSTEIYKAFVDAGVEIITLQGASNIAVLLKLFEQQLSGPSPSTPIQHRVREAVVIFLGTVVQHLPSNDKRVEGIIGRLLDVLQTPSEPVQRSVASCLEHIVARMPERAKNLLDHCLKLVLQPGKGGYAHQCGGSWGLAGLVKGLRPIALHQYPFIVERIQAAFNNKQDIDARIGASLSIECFSQTLGSGFEPWILFFLSNLIGGLGDGQIDVREVTLEAANGVMSQLSANGVRLVLPSLLHSLDDSSGKWKAKVGAIELVGAMGHCQPAQLGQCLPQIVPRLSALMADPHIQVQKVAKDALESICSTIHNPEVKKIVPVLLRAIDDPKQHSGQALEHLANTDFVNRIDNASLSLIMPVLDRALRERASETKKRATKIVGIMCNLTETKALVPYQKSLSEQLKVVLADPQPITRAMAAHALGQLVKGLDTAAEVVPYLLDTMKTPEVGMIERIGAAQGLAHVASHMESTGFRTSLLPRILATCDSPIPAARQGYLAVFQFLPDTLSSRFEPLLEAILPVVIKGLSDEQDMVRESALAGGQAIVKCFGDEKVDVLIPVLRQGLFDKNWRIRASSIQLLGELLYQISGASEDFAKKDISKMLEGDRASVLASLYLLRLDPMGAVSTQAVTVWKMLVVNTPKTLKALMPTLMNIIMKQLAAGDEEREVAAETLVELVNKMGDRVLGDIIPILERELDVASSETRVGICVGLAAVLETVPKHHIAEYFDILLPAITKALCDSESEVRSAAAGAFDGMYRGVGDRAINECLPVLLSRMEDPDISLSHSALQGVQQLLILRAQLILPILLPKLMTIPMTTFNAKALTSIAEVAGSGLTSFLHSIVPSLIRLKFAEPEKSENVPADPEILMRALHAVCLSAEGSGLGVLLSELARFTSEAIPKLRIAALQLLGHYAKVKGKTIPKGWLEQISGIIGMALKSYHDRDNNVVKSAIAALGDIMATIDPETVADSPINYIQTINDTLESLHVPDTLEGFSVPGGLAPLLPVFVAAMRTGSSELREQVSLGIRGIISKTEAVALTPAVLQAIAGALIRVLSEPNLESRIRADMLMTLNLLVERGGQNLSQIFATTLQVTYIKAISSTFKSTREQASIGIGRLIGLGAKPDFLIKALAPALKTAASTKPEECLAAIAKVYAALSADVMESTSTTIRDAIMPFMEGSSTSGHTQRAKAAEAMASTLRFLSPELAIARLKSMKLIDSAPSDHAEAGFLAIHHLMTLSTPFGTYLTQKEDIIEDIKLGLSVGDTAFIRGAAGQALGYLLVFVDDSQASNEYARALADALDDDDSVDVKICVLNAIRQFAKTTPDKAADLLSVLVPVSLQRVKKSILSLKYAAERALYHLLQIRTNPGLHQHFATTLPETHTKTFLDFCKVVLSKLPEHSDDEEIYDDGYTD
jgi:hypothetical protein